MVAMTHNVNPGQIPGLGPANERRRAVRDRRAEVRYVPHDGEMAAQIVRSSGGDVHPADLLDISRASVRLAIHAGVDFEPDENCVVTLLPTAGDAMSFSGVVVRTEEHSKITVLVIAFNESANEEKRPLL